MEFSKELRCAERIIRRQHKCILVVVYKEYKRLRVEMEEIIVRQGSIIKKSSCSYSPRELPECSDTLASGGFKPEHIELFYFISKVAELIYSVFPCKTECGPV